MAEPMREQIAKALRADLGYDDARWSRLRGDARAGWLRQADAALAVVRANLPVEPNLPSWDDTYEFGVGWEHAIDEMRRRLS
jgi:hypothetical protein